jgi:uncharacterized protein (TIGR03437 family)
MKRFALPALFSSLLLAVASAQQPVISVGPVNAASLAALGQANGGIAQGSMIVVKGSGLGACGTTIATSFPLKATMGTTSMKIAMAGSTFDVLMYYVVACQAGLPFPDQLAGVMPSNTPVGDGTVTVTNAGSTSAPVPIHVVATRFGIYNKNGNGNGPAVVQNFNSVSDQPRNSLVESAHPGQAEILWGNGLGAIAGDDSVPPPGGDMTNIPVDVFVGNKPAAVAYRGRTVYPSVDVIVFTVPDGVQGCYVPVAVRAAGVLSNVGTISVASSGKLCLDPAGFSTSDLQKLQGSASPSIGQIGLEHYHLKLSLGLLGTYQGTIDTAYGRFDKYGSIERMLGSVWQTATAGLHPVDGLSLPSMGCVIIPYAYTNVLSSAVPGVKDDPFSMPGLDAGAIINLSGPSGARQLARTGGASDFEYDPSSQLGGGIPGLPGFPAPTPDFLVPGNFSLDNGSGGAIVKGFQTSVTIPSGAVWSNQDALTNLPRSQDLTITWTGGVAGATVGIYGSSADPASGVGTAFSCSERAEVGSFVVPSWILSAMPASGVDASVGIRAGFLMLGNTGAPVRFQASGLDVGYVNSVTTQGKNVVFQ